MRCLRLLICFLLIPVFVWALTPAQIAQLQTELVTDPATLNYAPNRTVGNDAALVEQINRIRAGPAFQVFASISNSQLYGALNSNELLTFTEAQFTLLRLAMSVPTLDLADADVRAKLQLIFPAATTTTPPIMTGAPTTRANITALAQRPGSRAEVLWGPGTQVTQADVSRALRNTQ